MNIRFQHHSSAIVAVMIMIINLNGFVFSQEEVRMEKATFAGGCFWCMEPPFKMLDGVTDVQPGYTGGSVENPTYQQVSGGTTRHLEAVQITYDPQKTTYDELLDVYWMQIDPTDRGGQFADRGTQYTTAIFYHSETQQKLAEASKEKLANSGRFSNPIVTVIRPALPFYKAEIYHYNFSGKNPEQYKRYKAGSGREAFIEKTWKDTGKIPEKDKSYVKPSKQELKKRLTPLQYQVTQENATERSCDNAFWDNKAPGIYVDIVTGEPLFSSLDKYQSNTGWPSFMRPLEPENVVEKTDYTQHMTRTEIRSKHGDSHLGHVFDDGPGPSGMRYCLNSAAMRFIPKDSLAEAGYEKYLPLFKEQKAK